jgi:hypothetical protein
MNTPFQHFITLAQRVLDATNTTEHLGNPFKGVNFLSDKSVSFGSYPVYTRVQIIEHNNCSSVDVSFSCPIDFDCNGYDELFIEWTKNVEDFLASDSPLLLDNQIKADLRK